MQTEIWKPLGFMGYIAHEVSNFGRVRNKNGRILRKITDGNDYFFVRLSNDNGEKKNEYIHRLVAHAYIDNPENKPEVDHINRIRKDNIYTNLRWVNRSEQIKNKGKNVVKKGRNPVYQLDDNKDIIARWEKQKDAVIALNMGSHTCIPVAISKGQKAKGFYWKYCNEEKDEVWKEIPYPEYGKLWASKDGKIKNDKGYIYTGFKYGYYSGIGVYDFVNKKKKNVYMHVLIAAAFYGRNDKLEVNHINGNKRDNRIENLEFVTHSQNMKHAFNTGLVSTRGGWGRAVIQFDLEGKELNRFDSLKKAAEITGTSDASIAHVCRGKNPTTGGYRWKYADNGNNKVEFREDKSKRKVEQLDLDGKSIAKYKSIREATSKTGVNGSNIVEVCKGNRLTAGGYKWKYADS